MLIGLDPGQALGDHQVKEHAWVLVVDGHAEIRAGGERIEGRPGRSRTSSRTSGTPCRASAGPRSCSSSRPGPARATTAAAEGERVSPCSPSAPALAACARGHPVHEPVDEVAERDEEQEDHDRVEDRRRDRRSSAARQVDDDEDERREDRGAPDGALDSRLGIAARHRAPVSAPPLGRFPSRSFSGSGTRRRSPRPRRSRGRTRIRGAELRAAAAHLLARHRPIMPPSGRLARPDELAVLHDQRDEIAAEVVRKVAPVRRVDEDDVRRDSRARFARSGPLVRGRARRSPCCGERSAGVSRELRAGERHRDGKALAERAAQD